MAFGHEQLDVYRAAIEYVGWAYRYCEGLKLGEVQDFELIGAEGEVVQMFVVLPPGGLKNGPAPHVHVEGESAD